MLTQSRQAKDSARFRLSDEALYLYSSNVSPRYVQDVLDLLAMPAGAIFQFRYSEKWVEVAAARPLWGQLAGKKVLVHFSIQQTAHYHAPAFIPIRLGKVIRSEALGGIFQVEFELGDYVSLKLSRESGEPRDVYGPSVREYGAELEAGGVPIPYAWSAGLGPVMWNRIDVARADTDQMTLFARTVAFLSYTESFRQARYFRVIGFREAGEKGKKVKPNDGKFPLQCGRSYELLIAHTQPTRIERMDDFSVSADEGILKVIGEKSFQVGSKYDIVKVPVHAVQSTANERRETLLVIAPAAGVQGPSVRLPIQTSPDLKRTAFAVGGSAIGALFLGIPSLSPKLPFGWKAFFVITAAMLIGWLSSFGLKR